MKNKWLSIILPHHPIFVFDENSTLTSTWDEVESSLHSESRIAVREADLFVASPYDEELYCRPELRWISFFDLKNAAFEVIGKRETVDKLGKGFSLGQDFAEDITNEEIAQVCAMVPYKCLGNVALDFSIRKIVLHESQPKLLVIGKRKVCILQLLSSNFLRFTQSNDINCDAVLLGSYYYDTDEFNYVIDAQWHPLPAPEPIVGVLSSNGELRIFNLAISYADSVLMERFLPEKSGELSFGLADDQPVAFSFGCLDSGAPWDFASVFVLTSNGNLYGKCPLIVSGTCIPEEHLLKLHMTISDKSLEQASEKMHWLMQLFKSVKRFQISLPGNISSEKKWLMLYAPKVCISFATPLLQGPLLLQMASSHFQAQAVSLIIPRCVEWPVCLVSYENGNVHIYFRNNGLLPLWPQQSDSSMLENEDRGGLFPLYQNLDLQLKRTAVSIEDDALDSKFGDDVEPTFLITLVQDPFESHLIYALHEFGAHLISIDKVIELFTERLNIGLKEQAISLSNLVESVKLDVSPRIKVLELLTTVLVSINKKMHQILTNPISGMCLVSDSFLGDAGIFMARSGHVLVVQLRHKALDKRASISGLRKNSADVHNQGQLLVSAKNAASGLVTNTFQMPEWLVSWTAPKLMTASTVSFGGFNSASADVLLKLTERVREIGNANLHVQELSETLSDRSILQNRILNDVSKQARVLVKQCDTVVVDRHLQVKKKLLKAQNTQRELSKRVDAYLQILVDNAREVQLSPQELEWIGNLKAHALNVRKLSQETKTLAARFVAFKPSVSDYGPSEAPGDDPSFSSIGIINDTVEVRSDSLSSDLKQVKFSIDTDESKAGLEKLDMKPLKKELQQLFSQQDKLDDDNMKRLERLKLAVNEFNNDYLDTNFE